jgi:hypothetical protein
VTVTTADNTRAFYGGASILNVYKNRVRLYSKYMSKFELYSNKSATQFESHMQGLEEEIKKLLLDLRNFIKNLGSNVIEEVRPHRISYAKSLTYRMFLDIQPRSDSLIISVRKCRIESDTSYTVKTIEVMAHAKAKISEVYEKIK